MVFRLRPQWLNSYREPSSRLRHIVWWSWLVWSVTSVSRRVRTKRSTQNLLVGSFPLTKLQIPKDPTTDAPILLVTNIYLVYEANGCLRRILRSCFQVYIQLFTYLTFFSQIRCQLTRISDKKEFSDCHAHASSCRNILTPQSLYSDL